MTAFLNDVQIETLVENDWVSVTLTTAKGKTVEVYFEHGVSLSDGPVYVKQLNASSRAWGLHLGKRFDEGLPAAVATYKNKDIKHALRSLLSYAA